MRIETRWAMVAIAFSALFLAVPSRGDTRKASSPPARAERYESELPACVDDKYDNCVAEREYRPEWFHSQMPSQTFSGEWKRGKPNGYGWFTNSTGKTLFVGWVKKGEPVGPGILYEIISSVGGKVLAKGRFSRPFEEYGHKPEDLTDAAFPYFNETRSDIGRFSLLGRFFDTYKGIDGQNKISPQENNPLICYNVFFPYEYYSVYKKRFPTIPAGEADLLRSFGLYLHTSSEALFGRSMKFKAIESAECKSGRPPESRLPLLTLVPQVFSADYYVKRRKRVLLGAPDWLHNSKILTNLDFSALNPFFGGEAASSPNAGTASVSYALDKYPARMKTLQSLSSITFVDSINSYYPGNQFIRPCTTMQGTNVDEFLSKAFLSTILRTGILQETKGLSSYSADRFRMMSGAGVPLGRPKTYSSIDDFVRAVQLSRSAGSLPCNFYFDAALSVEKVFTFFSSQNAGSAAGLIQRQPDLAAADLFNAEIDALRAAGGRFSNFAEYDFLYVRDGQISAERQRLWEYGLRTEGDYMSLISEMKAAGYEANENEGGLLQYLADKGSADGAFALATQKKRVADAELQQQARQSEQRAEGERQRLEKAERDAEFRRVAKLYPQSILIECQVNGSSVGLFACLSGRSSTTLEIRNGRDYLFANGTDFSKMRGHFDGRAVFVPIKGAYSVTAQNAGDGVTLTVSIVDTLTRRVILQKSAGKYDVIRF